MFGDIVDIIILTFTHSDYGDCHNVIVDTINQSVARITDVLFWTGLYVHGVVMLATVGYAGAQWAYLGTFN